MCIASSLGIAPPNNPLLSHPDQDVLREPGKRYSRHATGDRMERAMSLGAVPDADEMSIGGVWMPGRQLCTWSGVPVAWVTTRHLSPQG